MNQETNAATYHIPVMLQETAEYLVADPAGTYIDGTLGGGGHAAGLLERFPGIKIIGLDCDDNALDFARARCARFGGRLSLYRENFGNIRSFVEREHIAPVQGLLVDLGVSSRQLDERARGFSFLSTNLDMRMDSRLQRTAADLVNTMAEDELSDIFYRYGEERFSRPVARRIADERLRARITSGRELAGIIETVKHPGGRIHPATQVFQALRIAVNRELEMLEALVEALPDVLAGGGRAVVMSYHSLEDRIVKTKFREFERDGRCEIITKKVIFASERESRENPRARSARIRVMQRI